MKLRDDILIKKVMDSNVIFPAGQSVIEIGNLMQLNDTGFFIAEKLQSEITYEDLLAAMAVEYEASDSEVEILRKDLDAFLEKLRLQGLMEG